MMEQARERRPENTFSSSMVSALVSASRFSLEFLLCLPLAVACKPNNPLFPQVAFGQYLIYHSNRDTN